MTRYIINDTAMRVYERTRTARAYKDQDGNAVAETASLGWFVQLSPEASVYLGRERPDIREGAKLKITIEEVL